jgi:RNA polymerase subunit RPABC4/transcription elongation factor Spt4
MTILTGAERADETCPVCGSVYSVKIHRVHFRDSDNFNCSVCGNEMRNWSGALIYEYALKSPTVFRSQGEKE